MDEPKAPLASRLAAGDPQAFAELYDAHVPALHGWLWARTGRTQTAEDVVQAVMLRVVRHRESLRRVRDLRAWLFAVARNECRRAAKRERRSVARADVAAAPAPARIEGAGDFETVRRHVARLDADRREVVVLHAWHGLTFEEIGRLVDVSPNTAASRWRLALEDLGRWYGRGVHVAP